MVYGLDAIFPLEFLIPTLQVAKDLDQIGLEELEKLDEIGLAIVVDMYALKRRQKQFHDHHILTK